jgi:competence protein ComEA
MRRRPCLLLCLLPLSLAPWRGTRAQNMAPSHPPPRLELNTATQAELERLKGVGVALSERLLQARAQAPFDGWADLQRRVSGLGPRVARRLADQGLTVNGAVLDDAAEDEAAAAAR